jgi:hypothetical protein
VQDSAKSARFCQDDAKSQHELCDLCRALAAFAQANDWLFVSRPWGLTNISSSKLPLYESAPQAPFARFCAILCILGFFDIFAKIRPLSRVMSPFNFREQPL